MMLVLNSPIATVVASAHGALLQSGFADFAMSSNFLRGVVAIFISSFLPALMNISYVFPSFLFCFITDRNLMPSSFCEDLQNLRILGPRTLSTITEFQSPIELI